jgi:ferritin-like protein
MHIDGEEMASDINKSIDKGVEGAKEILHDEAAKKIMETAKEEKEAVIKAVNKQLQESNISLPTEKK